MKSWGFGLTGAGLGLCVRGWGYVRMRRKVRQTPWTPEERQRAQEVLTHRLVFNRAAAAERRRMEDDVTYGRKVVLYNFGGALFFLVVGLTLWFLG